MNNTTHMIINRRGRWLALAAALLGWMAGALPAAAAESAGGGAAASLDASRVVLEIGGCAHGDREAMLLDVETRVSNAAAALRAMEQAAGSGLFRAPPPAFKEALAAAEASEGELRSRIDGARASAADAWPTVRNELAHGYTAYADAVIRAESALQGKEDGD